MSIKRPYQRLLLIVILALSFLSGCRPGPPAGLDDMLCLADLTSGLESLPAEDFLAEAFRRLALRSPEGITRVGLAGLYGVSNTALDSYDLQARLLTQAFEVELLGLAQRFALADLSDAVRLDLRSFIWYLEGQISLHPYQWFSFPLWNAYGSLTDQWIYLLMVQQPFMDEADVEDYLGRLEAIGPYIDGLIAYLNAQQAAGVRMPYVLYQEVMEEMGAHRWQVGRKTPFISVLAVRLHNLEGLSQDERQAYYDRGSEIADRVILPAVDRLMNALYTLADSTTEQIGLLHQPGGDAYYQGLVRQVTTLDFTPEEWFQQSMADLEALDAQTRRFAAEAGYDPAETLREIFRQATVDSDYALGLDIFVALRGLLLDAELAMSSAFELEVEKDLVMVPVLEGAYYEPAALDGSRKAAFYAGFTGQDALFDMPTLVYHETFPGRHYQSSVVQGSDLALFRKAFSFPAFDQGWALYAESLAWDLGLYADAANANLARMQQELLAAAQVVVDVGLHVYGWDLPQAARYLVDAAGIDRPRANALVLVQVAQPGQALAAYAGYSAIRCLRGQAESALGAAFDLQAFHTAVLQGGSLPLPLLEEQVRDVLGF